MPNSVKKSDGDAFTGVSFGGCAKAQDACGMTDCNQACTQVVGEAGDPAALEQATTSPVSVRPTSDQEGDDPRFATNNGLQMEQTVEARGQWVD